MMKSKEVLKMDTYSETVKNIELFHDILIFWDVPVYTAVIIFMWSTSFATFHLIMNNTQQKYNRGF